MRLIPALSLLMTTSLFGALAACGDFDNGSGAYAPYYQDMEQEPVAGDKFEAVGTNPFVVAEHDPFSTFATDVDTASYDIFRRDIEEQDRLPDPASVRLEEFVNAFDYDYPSPSASAEHPFAIALDAAPLPSGETVLFRVGLRARDLSPEERPAANLVFLVDVSGSMSASNKLPLVKVVLRELVTTLRPTDRIAIVTYASGERTLLESTPVSEASTILHAIDGLDAGGSTAGHAGLARAYQEAESAFIEGGVNHVVLCTDGDFNVGITSTEALVSFIEEKRESGVTLTALGFGYGNLNDAMMEKVTNAGNGSYAVITNEDHAIQYANQDLWRTIFLVARDTKIQVVFNPDHVRAYRLLGYENRALADDQFNDDRVDAGEVGAGHTVTALYELVLDDGAIPTVSEGPELDDGAAWDGEAVALDAAALAEVRVRYKGADPHDASPARELRVELPRADVGASWEAADLDTRFATAVAMFAEILKDSPFASRYLLADIAAELEATAGDGSDRYELLTAFERARQLLAEAATAEL
ncbi:MAG: DUF3520 domain-containing protein [Deltaproteobacteria bacterium]|nr:MAG: DUF3520 domain-containing protein [Deltaproteobacteria bacterium]